MRNPAPACSSRRWRTRFLPYRGRIFSRWLTSPVHPLRHANFSDSYAVGFAQVYSAIDLPPVENRWPADLLPPDQVIALERAAGDHHDLVRFASAHTLWSIRPDRAKHVLENQMGDWRDYVSRHAHLLLERYY
jgi:hypothetical protein